MEVMKKIIVIIAALFLSSIAFTQTVYTFNGNGNWSDPKNWVNNKLPPTVLDSGMQININPIINGQCILDTLQFLMRGANITIQTGKKLILSGNLINDLEDKTVGCNPSDLDSLLSVPILDTSKLPQLNRKNLPAFFELSMPSVIDLPEISNQGGQGSCTAFATAYATRSFYLHKNHCTSYLKTDQNTDLSKILSPAFIYNVGKASGSCAEAGMSIFKALSIMKNQGVCTWEKLPYDAKKDCAPPSDNSIYENGLIYKIDDFFRLDDKSETNVKYVLNTGNLIMASVELDYAYWVLGSYIWNTRIGKDVGGHAIVICGYDDAKHAYKIMNSYGKRWGYDGFGWIDYDYFKKMVTGSIDIFEPNRDIGRWEMFVMLTSSNFLVKIKLDPSTTILKENTITFRDFTEPEPTTREWSFEGGSPSTSKEIFQTVTYNTPGRYKATLTVQTCNGYHETKDTIITVLEPDGNFTDPRDGQVYPYKAIGTQVWMTKNLNYAAPGSWCYDNNSANCDKYGRLYDWNTALTVAPPGWHLPSDSEWNTLINFLTSDFIYAGGAMKSTIGWNPPNLGATNSSGFAGLPGGDRNGGGLFAIFGNFYDVGYGGFWWSSTEDNATLAWYRGLGYNGFGVNRASTYKPSGLSVRCIKD